MDNLKPKHFIGDKVNQKIKSTRVFNISDQSNKEFEHEKISIIKCNSFEQLENNLNDLSYFCFKKFPNFFVLIVEKLDSQDLKFLSEHLPLYKPFLIQVGEDFYIRFKNSCEFFQVCNQCTPKSCVEVLLNYINISLIEFDVEKIFNGEFSNLIIFAIESKDELCLRILRLYKWNLNQKINFLVENTVLQRRSLKIFKAYLGVFEENQITFCLLKKSFSLLSVNDWRNLLTRLVHFQNTKILKIVLKFHDFFLDSITLERVLNLSIDTGFSNIFEVIKTDDKKFIEYKILIESKIILLNEVQNFHENICKGDLYQLKKFIGFSNLRLCYGKASVCALEQALMCEKMKAYSFLRAMNFYTDRAADLDRRINNLSFDQKNLIREENLKYMKSFPKSFIGALLTKINFDAISPIESEEVREMLEILSDFEDIKPLFVHGSNSNVKIILDYGTASVKSMDPKSDEHTMGIAYFKKGQLFVGKNLDKFKRWGTFVHELMHFVLFMVYENGCKPYCSGDIERAKKWQEIINELEEEYKKNPSNLNDLIRVVFDCYSRNSFEAEMAVRACDMVANFCLDHLKVKEIQRKYSKLFNFHRKFVLPDLNTKRVLEVIRLNNRMEIFSKIKNSKIEVRNSASSLNAVLISENDSRIIISSEIPQIALLQIFHEIIKNSKNKLDIKSKNIFIDAQKLNEEKLKNLIYTSEVKRIIFDLTKCENFNFSFLDRIDRNVQFICIKNNLQEFSELKAFNFVSKRILHTWNDLTEKSKKWILDKKISFQGKNMKLQNILSPSDEISEIILKVLCSDNEQIIVNSKPFVKTEGYVEREIEVNAKESSLKKSISLQSFLLHTKSEKVVVISNSAGSGKTTILRKIQEMFVDDKENLNYVCFITLKNHLKLLDNFSDKDIMEQINSCEDKLNQLELLKNDPNQDINGDLIFLQPISNDQLEKRLKELLSNLLSLFQDFLADLLKFNELEHEIFKQKFANGKVKLLFDAFDEISPICKDKTLKLFKIFYKLQHENQIFITTRSHLKEDLETQLNTMAHSLKILETDEQIQVLVNCWKNSANQDKVLLQNYAKKLIGRIVEVVNSIDGVIGIPLIIQTLGSFYKNDINEEFEEKFKKLDISFIFQKIVIEANLQVLISKFPEKIEDILLKSDGFLKVFETLALQHLFGDEIVSELNLYYNESDWMPEEIIRGGLIKNFSSENFQFTHETYPEFLVAQFVFKILKSSKNPSRNQMSILLTILSIEKFKVSRLFLNNMLGIYDENTFKIFSSKDIFYRLFAVKTSLDKIQIFLINEHLTNIIKFCLEMLQSNLQQFKKFIENKDEFGRTFLMRLLPIVANDIFFCELLDKINICYGSNIYNSFLAISNNDGFTILHYLCEHITNISPLKIFWSKFLLVKEETLTTYNSAVNLELIEFKKLSNLEFQKLILIKGKRGETFLATANKNENLKLISLFQFLLQNLSKNNFKDLLLATLNINEFLIRCIYENDLIFFEFLVKTLQVEYNKDDFFRTLTKHNENNINFLHSVAQYGKSVEFLNFIFNKLEFLSLSKTEFKNFLLSTNKRGENALFYSIHCNNKIAFNYFFEKVFSNFLKPKDFIYKTDKYGNMILHFIIQKCSISTLKFLVGKFEGWLGENGFKVFLRSKSKRGLNLVHFAALSRKKYFLIYLFELIILKLSKEEFKNLLKQKDKESFLPLHCAVVFNEVDSFDYIFSVYEDNFTRLEIKNILRKNICKNKGNICDIAYENTVWESKMLKAVKKILIKYELISNDDIVESIKDENQKPEND